LLSCAGRGLRLAPGYGIPDRHLGENMLKRKQD